MSLSFSWFDLILNLDRSPNYVAHLKVLNQLLSSQRPLLATQITQYLLPRGFYELLSNAIQAIVSLYHTKSDNLLICVQPVQAKSSSKSLPLIIPLVTGPLSTFQPASPFYAESISGLFLFILTIPLLPNRLPLPSLTALSSRLPLATLSILDPAIPSLINSTSIEGRIHLLANLLAFTTPRYRILPASALDTYLHILTSLLNSIPINCLHPPTPGQKSSTTSWAPSDSDSDDEDSTIRVTAVSTFTPPPPPVLPPLDARTVKRLQTLSDPTHINALLTATISHPSTRLNLVSFFLALNTVSPANRDKVLSTVLVYTGGGLVRELYRGYVRGSPLGKDDNAIALMGEYLASDPRVVFSLSLLQMLQIHLRGHHYYS